MFNKRRVLDYLDKVQERENNQMTVEELKKTLSMQDILSMYSIKYNGQ